MARTKDRTLLASLGFQDKDRRSTTHTLACQYLAQPSVAQRVVDHLLGQTMAPDRSGEKVEATATVKARKEVWQCGKAAYLQPMDGKPPMGDYYTIKSHGRIEAPIMRGTYFVGFWDVRLEMSKVTECVRFDYGTHDSHSWDGVAREQYHGGFKEGPGESFAVSGVIERTDRVRAGFLNIEVKASEAPIADVIAQVSLYKQYHLRPYDTDRRMIDVVATCYPMPRMDRDTLKASSIHHVYLGAPFEAWCQYVQSEADHQQQREF